MSSQIKSSHSQSIPESDDVEASEEGAVLVNPESDTEPVLSIVMPTLNEEDGVGECIERSKAALAELDVPGEIILSDSSTDRTPEIGTEMGARVINPPKKGYGFAYRYAFDHARGDYVVMGDADTTYDFSAIPRLLKPVRNGEVDIVMGSRLEGEIEDGAMPALHEYVGNPLLTKFLNVFYDAGVSDAHSGFRVFRRDVLDELDLRTNGMEFASEMIMEAGARDVTIEEVPITYHERTGDATLESFRDGWRHVRFMLVNAPGYLFSIPGAAIGTFGALVMGLAWSGLSFSGASLGIHSMLAGSLLVILGWNVVSLGVFATVSSDPIQTPQGPFTRFVREWATLERGASLGLVLAATGFNWAGLLVWQWISNGFSSVAFTMGSILAFTAIVIGVQVVFSSFFLSSVR